MEKVNSTHPYRKSSVFKYVKTEYPLLLFLVPCIVVTFLFSYLPMFTNYIAFLDYDMTAGWLGFGSRFVGFHNFMELLKDNLFVTLTLRTLYYSAVTLIARIPIPLILALLLNELRTPKFKRVSQTLFYLPHFVSWVTIGSLVYQFMSTDTTGLINNIRQFFGATDRVIFLKSVKIFPLMLVVTEAFKSAGWGSIMYLAAIGSIDPQLYEAAMMDGAGRFRQLIHITFPGILPTMVILIIFSIGSLFSTNFDQIYNLQNPIIEFQTNTINVYSYYKGIRSGNYEVASAIGLFQGVVNCVLLISANTISKKVTQYGLF